MHEDFVIRAFTGFRPEFLANCLSSFAFHSSTSRSSCDTFSTINLITAYPIYNTWKRSSYIYIWTSGLRNHKNNIVGHTPSSSVAKYPTFSRLSSFSLVKLSSHYPSSIGGASGHCSHATCIQGPRPATNPKHPHYQRSNSHVPMGKLVKWQLAKSPHPDETGHHLCFLYSYTKMAFILTHLMYSRYSRAPSGWSLGLPAPSYNMTFPPPFISPPPLLFPASLFPGRR